MNFSLRNFSKTRRFSELNGSQDCSFIESKKLKKKNHGPVNKFCMRVQSKDCAL